MIHTRPDYDIQEVPVEGRQVPVLEEAALDMPFANLVHFRKETNIPQPRVLLVAPMAGHFPHSAAPEQRKPCCAIMTFTSPTGKAPAMCRWRRGLFGTDEYVDYLIRFSGKDPGPAPIPWRCANPAPR